MKVTQFLKHLQSIPSWIVIGLFVILTGTFVFLGGEKSYHTPEKNREKDKQY